MPPACGGKNPNPCHNSTAPGGRTARLMLAHLTSRKPLTGIARPRPAADDVVPWGTPYVPGAEPAARLWPDVGTYTLRGRTAGSAEVVVGGNGDGAGTIGSVAVAYDGFSDDGVTFLNGRENVTTRNPELTVEVVDWFSDLVQRSEGEQQRVEEATKKTSEGGFHLEIDAMTNIFIANGSLTTTTGDGKVWKQPANET